MNAVDIILDLLAVASHGSGADVIERLCQLAVAHGIDPDNVLPTCDSCGVQDSTVSASWSDVDGDDALCADCAQAAGEVDASMAKEDRRNGR